ncbi:MAG: HIT domain-containing protein [Phycisphaeraceae bacterium]|nr:HIT domain-containing protein [Phycisphaeraceae bacterium]
MHSNLWAPWRMAYLRDLEARSAPLAPDRGVEKSPANFFASYWAAPAEDERNLVVHRNAHGMILLNRFPYANGHLLVALGDARPTLSQYSADQRREFWALVDLAAATVESLLRPQGMNIGLNVGRAAGAGVPEHVHAHVVPRWAGDTNFMCVIGEVRLIPEDLEATARSFRSAFSRSA